MSATVALVLALMALWASPVSDAQGDVATMEWMQQREEYLQEQMSQLLQDIEQSSGLKEAILHSVAVERLFYTLVGGLVVFLRLWCVARKMNLGCDCCTEQESASSEEEDDEDEADENEEEPEEDDEEEADDDHENNEEEKDDEEKSPAIVRQDTAISSCHMQSLRQNWELNSGSIPDQFLTHKPESSWTPPGSVSSLFFRPEDLSALLVKEDLSFKSKEPRYLQMFYTGLVRGRHTYRYVCACVCVHAVYNLGNPTNSGSNICKPSFTSDVCNQWDSFCFSTRDSVQERSSKEEVPGQEGKNCGETKGSAFPASTSDPFRCSYNPSLMH